MLYRQIIAVCSQIQTKHINAVCGQNVELLGFELLMTCLYRVQIKTYVRRLRSLYI